jgi:hypothetical protein
MVSESSDLPDSATFRKISSPRPSRFQWFFIVALFITSASPLVIPGIRHQVMG